MKNKTTVKVHIYPMAKMDGRYAVVLTCDPDGAILKDDKDGKGYMLYQAQHLLLRLHDAIKPACQGQ